MLTYYEFFAGGGMARAGLGSGWQCTFANEFDPKKAASYEANWGKGTLLVRDVAEVKPLDLPGVADLAWASFPCQDLSLAGSGAGLKGDRSGTFWPFWRLMEALGKRGRAPRVVVLENVCGALTSHGGKDFGSICTALSVSGYRFGAVVMDAVDFLPHSRPRLFIIGVIRGVEIPRALRGAIPEERWHSKALVNAQSSLNPDLLSKWVWWTMPAPRPSNVTLADLLEDEPNGLPWHSAAETKRLLSMMSVINLAKVRAAKREGRRVVGAIYKRTRPNEHGVKVQRAEIRFDDISGCLRTPIGGSSRQVMMIVEGERVRSRLMSPRETARLMGLKDSYILPKSYNEGLHLTGDGLVVPVVRHLARHIVEPIVGVTTKTTRPPALRIPKRPRECVPA